MLGDLNMFKPEVGSTLAGAVQPDFAVASTEKPPETNPFWVHIRPKRCLLGSLVPTVREILLEALDMQWMDRFASRQLSDFSKYSNRVLSIPANFWRGSFVATTNLGSFAPPLGTTPTFLERNGRKLMLQTSVWAGPLEAAKQKFTHFELANPTCGWSGLFFDGSLVFVFAGENRRTPTILEGLLKDGFSSHEGKSPEPPPPLLLSWGTREY